MNGPITLTEKLWVSKLADRETYYEMRHDIKNIERFAREYVGWRLVSNEKLIKYEKVPAKAESFMGIESFQDKRDYVFLLVLLIFLEDKEDEESFLLSELIDMIELQLKEKLNVDWTEFTQRKSLVRVIRFAQETGMIIERDGNLDQDDIKNEVLYENTGLSRYFAVNYSFDTSTFHTYHDFENYDSNVNADRGHFRINRVYRTLAACPAMYWNTVDDADSLYLKNQRQWVAKYLHDYLGMRLDIHKNAAFSIMEEEIYGDVFPNARTLSDIILLVCGAFREMNPELETDDTVCIEISELENTVKLLKEKYAVAWSKEYRSQSVERIVDQVIKEMEDWMMLKREDGKLRLFPGAFKFAGVYPAHVDFSVLGERETGGGISPESKEIIIREEKKLEKNEFDGQLSLFEL